MTTATIHKGVGPPSVKVREALAESIKKHRATGDADMWHGSEEVDIHIYQEDTAAPIRWFAYPVVPVQNGADNLTTDTSRLLDMGLVPAGGTPEAAANVRLEFSEMDTIAAAALRLDDFFSEAGRYLGGCPVTEITVLLNGQPIREGQIIPEVVPSDVGYINEDGDLVRPTDRCALCDQHKDTLRRDALMAIPDFTCDGCAIP